MVIIFTFAEFSKPK